MVWKSNFFRGSLRFVRVPPYESWANWTNFYFSCGNGDILLSRKFCNLFHTKNEEKSQKISNLVRISTCVYANTWQGGHIVPPPALNRVNQQKPFKESCQLVCLRAVLFCFVYDHGLWSEDPSRDCSSCQLVCLRTRAWNSMVLKTLPLKKDDFSEKFWSKKREERRLSCGGVWNNPAV